MNEDEKMKEIRESAKDLKISYGSILKTFNDVAGDDDVPANTRVKANEQLAQILRMYPEKNQSGTKVNVITGGHAHLQIEGGEFDEFIDDLTGRSREVPSREQPREIEAAREEEAGPTTEEEG